jgi:uncharacterized BrkB/YihY/UPF0761 family membrane protein
MTLIVDQVKAALRIADRWQRRHPVVARAYGVVKKYGNDNAGTLVVALGWYGFTAIYPLLLVIVTVFGFIGASSLGSGVINELHQFPVVGAQFNPGTGSSSLHGSIFGLVIGVLGLLYGSLGVTNTAQQVMGRVWNVPQVHMPGFLPRLWRSLVGLLVIGAAFAVTAATSSEADASGRSWALRVPVVVALVALNTGFYSLAFRVLTPAEADAGSFLPGALAGGVGFTFLTTVGTGLVQHQLRHTTATYGALASVIGVVAYLLLLAKISVYAAELNPVLHRGLWPRALPTTPPTEADDEVLRDLAHEQRRRKDEHVGVGFGADPDRAAGIDSRQSNDATGVAPGRGDTATGLGTQAGRAPR